MKNERCRMHDARVVCQLRRHAGFTYVALLVAIVIIGISLSSAGKYWSAVMQREKEEELLFRGDQYRLAIERYYQATPCASMHGTLCVQKAGIPYPESVEKLLQDDRFPQAKHHLRRNYLDPMTGDEFELVRDKAQGNRITGVYSKSEKTPIKQDGFPDPYGEFAGKQTYAEWQFVFKIPQPAPGQPGVPGQPGAPFPRRLPTPSRHRSPF